MGRKTETKGSNGNSGSRIRLRFVDIEVENVDETIYGRVEVARRSAFSWACSSRSFSSAWLFKTQLAGQSAYRRGGHRVDDQQGETEVEGPGIQENRPARKRSVPKAPVFLSNVDLTASKVPLEDFVKEKDASDMFSRYIVVIFWFKEYLSIEEVTIDHIFTAFKHLGWQSLMPGDPAQPFREIKFRKNWLDKGSKGAYKINWNGINYVNKMGPPTQ